MRTFYAQCNVPVVATSVEVAFGHEVCLSFFCKTFVRTTVVAVNIFGGLDSSVGTATRWGVDGPGIEFRWGKDFSHPSRPALGPTLSPIQGVSGLFPGGKAAVAWR